MTDAGADWSFSDAWVMTAVAISGKGGCDLSGLIGAADACNHAILTTEELAVGIGRLVASGLLAHEGVRFRLTAAGQRLAAQREGNMFSQVGSIERLLAAVPLLEGRWDVTSEEASAAYASYIKRIRISRPGVGRLRRSGKPPRSMGDAPDQR